MASTRDEPVRDQAQLEKANAECHPGGESALTKVMGEIGQFALAPAAEPSIKFFYNMEDKLDRLIRYAS